MGSGTSHGVPVIGCKCKVCKSTNPKDKRNRCSAYIFEPVNIVVDTGPEFRIQALKFGIEKIDAVCITHSHADHLNGLDDLRIFSHTQAVDPSKNTFETQGNGLPIYTNSRAIIDTVNRFDYIFKPVKEGGGKPKLDLHDVRVFGEKNPIYVKNNKSFKIIPIPLLHGTLMDTGWLFLESKDDFKTSKGIAYLTDCNKIEDSSFDLIARNCTCLEHLVIDALRLENHSTHFSFEEAFAAAERICAKHTWFTHMTHNMADDEINDFIKEKLPSYPKLQEICKNGGTVSTAYDGLLLET